MVTWHIFTCTDIVQLPHQFFRLGTCASYKKCKLSAKRRTVTAQSWSTSFVLGYLYTGKLLQDFLSFRKKTCLRRKLAQICVITLALYLKNNICNNHAQRRISSRKELVSCLINIFSNITLLLTTVWSYLVSKANKVHYNICKLVIQVRPRNESAKSCIIMLNKAVSFPNFMYTHTSNL